MKSEWKKDTLIKYIDLIGGGTPKTSVAEYWNGSIPWLSVKDFNNDNRYVYTTEKHISEQGLLNSSTKLLQKDDIIISARGTVGELAMIPFPMAFNQSCYGIRAKDGLNKAFLYYLLKSKIAELKKITHGSVFDTITRETFSNIIVDIPDYQTQCTIASILGGLDSKIELNNKINDNLEQQAEALYKAWFIDYLPFAGEKPEEWNNTIIEELTSLVSRGITPKYTEDSDQIVINQKCVRDHRIDLSLARTHTPKKINEKWLQYGDLLINSTGEGTLGRAAQVWFKPEKMTVDSHVTIVRPKSKELMYYIGFWGLVHEKEIESLHTGSTGQTELPRERIKAMELVLPDQTTLAIFNAIVQPMTETIINNQIQNNKLAALRDALLPKLMSGEIDVENIRV